MNLSIWIPFIATAVAPGAPSTTLLPDVAYLSGEPYSLRRMDANGDGDRELVPSARGVLHFDAGPRGIAYVADPDDDEMFELTLLPFADGEARAIGRGIRFYPRWSPDGRRLAFMNHAGRWKIQLTGRDDLGALTELCPPDVTRFDSGQSVNDGAPAWSPDGKWIAFQSNRPESVLALYIANVETGELRRLTDDVRARAPRFSPDGRWISFDAEGALHRIRPDGSEERVVAPEETLVAAHQWLPGSERLLVTYGREGERELGVLDATSREVINVTRHAADDHSPAVSPDGEHVLFVSDRGGDTEVYRMRIDGSAVVQLTDNDVRDAAPSWLPASVSTRAR